MNARLARGFLVSGCLCCASLAGAKQVPQLSKDQRALLQAVVAAVDAAAAAPNTDADAWQTHVLRASDGSHYVAFSVVSTAAEPIAAAPLMTYVRLATAAIVPATAIVERSAVREWLAGSRIDPRLLPRNRGFAVGEMPPMGAGSIGARGGTSVGSADLQILGLERERNRERKADEEKQRRAALERAGQSVSEMLPFEDFDVLAPSAFADGTPAIQRALTTGPGRYDLYVAWVEASAKPGKAAVRVARRSLDLPPASRGELGISTVIVADRIAVRDTPYSALEQRSHPYAIGLTEITPARDAVFSRDDRISVAFQVVNPTATDTGKPDIAVNFRIVRVAADREEPVAALSPLRYDATTLPADFDVRLGHPVLAAMSAPLTTLSRAAYRLHISVADRVSGAAALAHTDFRIIGTPASLLGEAPPLARRFRREIALEAGALGAILDTLRRPDTSAALARALDAARDRRFADLMHDEPVPPAEQGTRAALTAIALFSFGDASAAAQFQRAASLGAPPAVLQYFAGAIAAAAGREVEAVTAWQGAIDGGLPRDVVLPLLGDTYLRMRDPPRALAAATEWRDRSTEADAWRALAAAYLAADRATDAVPILESRLRDQPGDLDAQWLLLHAEYATIVKGGGRDEVVQRDRFGAAVATYLAAGGPHAALAGDWLAATMVRPD